MLIKFLTTNPCHLNLDKLFWLAAKEYESVVFMPGVNVNNFS